METDEPALDLTMFFRNTSPDSVAQTAHQFQQETFVSAPKSDQEQVLKR